MAWYLRTLPALAEDLGSTSRTHLEWSTIFCDSDPKESNTLLWFLQSPAHMWYTHAHIGTHRDKRNKLQKRKKKNIHHAVVCL